MVDIVNYRAMELFCLERAKTDPVNRGKWISQAERWDKLGRSQTAWRSQNRNNHSLHAGPMAMGPNSVNGDARTYVDPVTWKVK
jgi:hypothetical protein